MRVGWLVDEAPYIGGAELTMAEFRAAAPEGVEIIDCPPGEVVSDLDVYVIGNCTAYIPSDIAAANGPMVRYIHDVWPHGDPAVRLTLLDEALCIFCPPLHRDRFPWTVDGPSRVIPPAINLEGRDVATTSTNSRDGAVWIGRLYPGKGVAEALEWSADADEPLDFYGHGPLTPEVGYRGEIAHDSVPVLLAGYKTFVFLPTAIEPFGRGVVEAWAAGVSEFVLNGLVGARHYLIEDQDALATAATDFWKAVTDKA